MNKCIRLFSIVLRITLPLVLAGFILLMTDRGSIIDNITASAFSTIIRACDGRNLPCFGFVSDQAEKGAVLVLSRDYEQAGRDAVVLAGKILNGTDPGILPFEFVSKTAVIINTKAARRYGIRIPEQITRSAVFR